MSHHHAGHDHDRWARLRFAVVGPLPASPPERGRLRALGRLAQQSRGRHERVPVELRG